MSLEIEDSDSEIEFGGDEIVFDSGASTSNNFSVDVSRYQHLKGIPHVLQCPGMYMDDISRSMRTIWALAYNGDNMLQMKTLNFDLPLGLERLMIEAIANICDHSVKSRLAGCNPGMGIIEMTSKSFKGVNGGMAMPVAKNSQDIWIPEMNFGKLRSGSNFNEQREGGGLNGLGIKLANIFSERFAIRIKDSTRNLVYSQQWGPNMQHHAPTVAEEQLSENSVTVIFAPQMYRFGYPDGDFPEGTMDYFRRHAADASLTAKMPFSFNGVEFNYSSILDYANLFFPKIENYLIHYEWPSGTEVIKHKDGTETAKNGCLPIIELIAVDSPDSGIRLGFANSVMNQEGGTHVDAAIRAVTGALMDELNNKPEKVTKTRGAASSSSSSSADKAKSNIPQLTIRDIRPHITIIVSWRGLNPVFNSQAKTKLREPKVIDIHIHPDKLKKVKRWELAKKLKDIINMRKMVVLSKTDGKKTKFIGEIKGDDAFDAGTNLSSLCTLAGLEGDSAKTYGTILCGFVPGGRRRLGLFTFRGKIINAMKNSPDKLAENKELIGLKKMLGICENTDYRIPQNKAKLRYGSFMVMTDADKDGHHIKGLFLALVEHLWGSLLDENFIQDWRTPIIRMYKGNQVQRFYFESEVEIWKAKNPDWTTKWRSKYYKGLGNSDKADVKDDFEHRNLVTLIKDPEASNMLKMAFGKDNANMRKQWLSNFDPDKLPTPILNGRQNISTFVNEELIQYAIASLKRHICGMDGLHPVNRKAIFGAFKKWGKMTNPTENKMTAFVSYVGDLTQYHHGDALSGVIKRMTMSFVGMNNIPYFEGHGGFGTRNEGGKDASSDRYLTIKPNSWFLRHVFVEDDETILNYMVELTDEGEQSIEPEFYLPIIPLDALNGSRGVGVSVNTNIPAHHLLDLVEYYINRCNNEKITHPQPWYRDFRGDLQVVDTRPKGQACNVTNVINDLIDDDDDEEEIDLDLDLDMDIGDVLGDTPTVKIPKNNKYSMLTRGIMEVDNDRVVVTELPIGLWMDTYKNQLVKMQSQGVIKDHFFDCDDVKVRFEIMGYQPRDKDGNHVAINAKNVGIERSQGLILVKLDEKCHPKRYRDMSDLFDDFYKWRLPYFDKRKTQLLRNMSVEIGELNDRIAFIQAVIDGRLVLVKGDGKSRLKKDVLVDIENLKLKSKYYESIRFYDCSTEKINKYQEKRNAILQCGRQLKATPPSQLWINDLEALRERYLKRYGDDRRREFVFML